MIHNDPMLQLVWEELRVVHRRNRRQGTAPGALPGPALGIEPGVDRSKCTWTCGGKDTSCSGYACEAKDETACVTFGQNGKATSVTKCFNGIPIPIPPSPSGFPNRARDVEAAPLGLGAGYSGPFPPIGPQDFSPTPSGGIKKVCTAPCPGGSEVTCPGSWCAAADFVGCSFVGPVGEYVEIPCKPGNA